MMRAATVASLLTLLGRHPLASGWSGRARVPSGNLPAAAQPAEEAVLPDIGVVGVQAVKQWAADRISVGERDFADDLGRSRAVAGRASYRPSPATWAGVVVYHLMPDRFNNGDPSNDHKNVPKLEAISKARRHWSGGGGLPNWRHGGDIQGIRDRLGYLQDLGVQALWITPVLMHDGVYHGYHAVDLTAVDPGFGSAAELRALVVEAHEHGVSVVLDVVVNHMCDHDTHYMGEPDHYVCTDARNDAYWMGQEASEAGTARMNFSSSFFPPFRTDAFFNRCGPNTNDDTSGTGPATVFGDFFGGMFDYNTQNKDFQEIITNLFKYWIAVLDVDGLRLDAAKHVTVDFLAYFSTEVRAYASTLGKTNFLIVGEVAAKVESWKAMTLGRMMSDPQEPSLHGHVPERLTQCLHGLRTTYLSHPVFPAPGLGSVYNFNVSGTSRYALRCDEPSVHLEDFFGSETERTLLSQSVPQAGAAPDAHLWTAIEIHDWPRFLNMHSERLDLLITGLAWLLTAPGSPILYAGIEQGFNGRCPEAVSIEDPVQRADIEKECHLAAKEEWGSHPDGLKRQDMFAHGPWRLRSAVAAVNRTAYVGPPASEVALCQTDRCGAWQTDEMLPRDHVLYRFVQRMIAFRRSCAVISQGATVFHTASSANCGFIAFSRVIVEVARSQVPTGRTQRVFRTGGHSVCQDVHEVVVLINPGGIGGGGDVHLAELMLKGEVHRTGGQLFVDALNPNRTASVRAAASGEVFLVFDSESGHLARGSVSLFMPDGMQQPFDSELGISLCSGEGTN